MSYRRVIPRDLFNEAKLLKCMGQLALLVHDGKLPSVTIIHDGSPFTIEQAPDGDLYLPGVRVFVGGEPLTMGTVLNSKEPYPLIFGEEQHPVFDNNGQPSFEFLVYIRNQLKPSVSK